MHYQNSSHLITPGEASLHYADGIIKADNSTTEYSNPSSRASTTEVNYSMADMHGLYTPPEGLANNCGPSDLHSYQSSLSSAPSTHLPKYILSENRASNMFYNHQGVGQVTQTLSEITPSQLQAKIQDYKPEREKVAIFATPKQLESSGFPQKGSQLFKVVDFTHDGKNLISYADTIATPIATKQIDDGKKSYQSLEKQFTTPMDDCEYVEAPLDVDTLPVIQEKEKNRQMSTLLFLKKHAAAIRKYLLVGAINYSLRKKFKVETLNGLQSTKFNEDITHSKNASSTCELYSREARELAQLHQAPFSQTSGDAAFERDLKNLLNEYGALTPSISNRESGEIDDFGRLLSSFPESSLLTIYACPLLIEYFADNMQLLYLLDMLRPQIIKEWEQSEFVQPCLSANCKDRDNGQMDFTIQETEDHFNSVLYPQFCMHKSKRLVPIRVLEAYGMKLISELQQERALNQGFYPVPSDSNYISEAIRIIKEQKGLKKASLAQKNSVQQTPTPSAFNQVINNSQYQQYTSSDQFPKKRGRKPKALKELLFLESQAAQINKNNLKRAGAATSDDIYSNNSENQRQAQPLVCNQFNPSQCKLQEKDQSAPNKKRDRDSLLECAYCLGSYHLSCIISNPRWNKDLESESIQSNIKILGKRKSEQPVIIRDSPSTIASSSEDTHSSGDRMLAPRKKFSDSLLKSTSEPPLECQSSDPNSRFQDKTYISEFLERIGFREGFRSQEQKWACKNCLLSVMLDQLGTASSDQKFQQEVSQSEFLVLRETPTE